MIRRRSICGFAIRKRSLKEAETPIDIVPSEVWQAAFSIAGALVVGAAAMRQAGVFRHALHLGDAAMFGPGSRYIDLSVVRRCSSPGADNAIGPTLPSCLCGPHPLVLSKGLICPKDGCASIASAEMATFNFLPLVDHPVG